MQHHGVINNTVGYNGVRYIEVNSQRKDLSGSASSKQQDLCGVPGVQ